MAVFPPLYYGVHFVAVSQNLWIGPVWVFNFQWSVIYAFVRTCKNCRENQSQKRNETAVILLLDSTGIKSHFNNDSNGTIEKRVTKLYTLFIEIVHVGN